MFKVESGEYSPEVTELIKGRKMLSVVAKGGNNTFRSKLLKLRPETILGDQKPADMNMAKCCLAGLFLYHDFVGKAHSLCEGVKSLAGCYWHGFVHRHEADFANASYWVKRCGNFPFHDSLCLQAKLWAGERDMSINTKFLSQQRAWEPLAFLDFVEREVKGEGRDLELCQMISDLEWRMLFHYCYQKAKG
ncbi:MAG: hypothetical protein MPJ24_03350 [Pirellulaceae bacterium]|nr:hypothetical protein [Pirellulaceae bacterium]